MFEIAAVAICCGTHSFPFRFLPFLSQISCPTKNRSKDDFPRCWLAFHFVFACSLAHPCRLSCSLGRPLVGRFDKPIRPLCIGRLHKAQSSSHKVRSSLHKAQSSLRKARSSLPKARSSILLRAFLFTRSKFRAAAKTLSRTNKEPCSPPRLRNNKLNPSHLGNSKFNHPRPARTTTRSSSRIRS